MLNFSLFLCLFVAFVAAEDGVLTVNGPVIDEDGVVINEAAAAMLRRLAEKVPLLALNRSVRAFVDVRYANWMKQLPENVQNMPLSGIAIPGSHDSFTSTLNYHAEMGPSPDLSDTLVKVINFFGSAAKKIIYNWGVTQSHSLSDQLTAGIRYLDFRVAKRESKNGDFYLLHSLYAQSVKSAFAEVLGFLDSHNKEVVIIDMNHFYDMNSADHDRLVSEIYNTFGSRLVTVRSWYELTLANIWKEGKQVVLIYQGYVRERDSRLWRGGDITSPWLQTNKVSKALEKLNFYYKLGHHPDEDGFFVAQGVLSAEANDIIWGVASSLRSKMGLPMCRATSDWVKDKKIGKGGLNIVITDFVLENNFIGNVIALNHK